MKTHRKMHPFLRVLVLLAWCVAAVPASAAAQRIPARPALPRGADANDWEAYVDHGTAIFRDRPNEARAAFYWAARLNPERAEPVFGQWAAHWMLNLKRWEQYLREPEHLRERPEVVRADSLLHLAFVRNPFVHRGLETVLYDQLPGQWRNDFRTRAWIAYTNGDLDKAIGFFDRAARSDPKDPSVRFARASALTSAGRFAEALDDMTALVRTLRERDDTERFGVYESKAMLEYGIGLLHLALGDSAQARDAFARALVDDLSFAPAHAALGDLASGRRDFAEAIRAYEQALELSPKDAVFRSRFATVLARSGAASRAEEQVREAIALEPHYPSPYVHWGQILEQLGRTPEAQHAYAEYLRRAPARAPARAVAQARLSALLAASGAGTPDR